MPKKSKAPATGHNNPPTSPFEESKSQIDDLYMEAQNFLDGDPVDTEGLAEAVSTLLQNLREAGSLADKRRGEENKPHWDAGKAVDAKFKPLAAMVTRATEACKETLKPWLLIKAEEKEAEDLKLREEADRKKREADRAMQTSSGNLAEREAAEEKVEEAKAADIKARVSKNATAGQTNRGGRAVSLRTVWNTTLTDPDAALDHFWPDARLEEVLLSMAKGEVRSGKRTIPGFHIEDEKVPV